MTSMNGSFSLATRSGLIRLKGDHDSLFGHNGQQQQNTRQETPSAHTQLRERRMDYDVGLVAVPEFVSGRTE